MLGTRWDSHYDLEAFVEGRNFNDDQFDAVAFAIDQAKVKSALVRLREHMDAEKAADVERPAL
ncbi:hypothetical protein DVS77_26220 [Mycolicibacterium moriokaense]|nr:hypothetical protein DVS77_26220 [Mycolicibacterium moriokaense]